MKPRKKQLLTFRDLAKHLLARRGVEKIQTKIDGARAHVVWKEKDGTTHVLDIVEDYVRPAWRLGLDRSSVLLRGRLVEPTTILGKELSLAAHEVEAVLRAWLGKDYEWTAAGTAAYESEAHKS